MFTKVCVLDHMDGSVPTVEVYGPFRSSKKAEAFVRPDDQTAAREFHLVVEVTPPA